jgi:dihydroorotase
MWIDSHVHCRGDRKGEEESEKDTIAHVLEVARDSGIDVIIDKGNLARNPVTTRARAIERMNAARDADSPVYYFMYMMLTKNPEQIREAVETAREFFPKKGDKAGVIGINMYAGPSTGNLGVLTRDEQLGVDREVVRQEYTGVYGKHCEQNSLFKKKADGSLDWDEKNPASWNLARPEESDAISVFNQIFDARILDAKYHLHILHVSSPISVDTVNESKRDMNVTCEITPQHLLLDASLMLDEQGVLYKVNPPLRSPETRKKLLLMAAKGMIDTLATDHAPHTIEDKLEKYASGIPGIASWPDFIPILIDSGLGQERINKMAWENPIKIFGLEKLGIEKTFRPLVSHICDYAFDPYLSYKNKTEKK